MINLTAARTGLEALVLEHCPSIRGVHARAVENPVIVTPAVVLASLVSGEFDQVRVACPGMHNDSIDLSVAVLVARDGTAEEATQQQLEQAWVEVLDALRDRLDIDLADVGYARRVSSVEPGSYVIAGAEYPAQILHIIFEG